MELELGFCLISSFLLSSTNKAIAEFCSRNTQELVNQMCSCYCKVGVFLNNYVWIFLRDLIN